MPLTEILIAGSAGALLGPRLRSVIFTASVPTGSAPRRTCPACPAELLPIGPSSQLAALPMSGRCPACGQRIGPPAGSVELLGALTFVALAMKFTSPSLVAGLCWLAACGIALAFIDVAVRRLPNILIGIALAGLLVALSVTALADSQPASLLRAVLAGLAALGGYTAVSVLSAGMGFGDGKLAAVLGIALGWFSWTSLLAGAMMAFIFCGLYLVALRLLRRSPRPAHIPFGPFLLLGALAAAMVTT